MMAERAARCRETAAGRFETGPEHPLAASAPCPFYAATVPCRYFERGVMRGLIVAVVIGGLCVAGGAYGNDLTEVFGADEDGGVRLRIMPHFDFRSERSVIAREAPCEAAVSQRCNEDSTILNRELDYARTTATLGLKLQAGLARGLELHVDLPFVIADGTTISFADEVDQTNSSVDPSDGRIAADLQEGGTYDALFATYRLFDVANGTTYDTRRGLGDMSVGVSWLAFDQSRQPHTADFAIRLGYTAPTGSVREGDNTAVGSGLHWIRAALALGRQYGPAYPYFGADFGAPFPGGRSLFSGAGDSQPFTRPGIRAEAAIGVELTVYENPNNNIRIAVDARGEVGYVGEGRDYSPLFEALADSSCNGTTFGAAAGPSNGGPYRPDPAIISPELAQCAWVVQEPGNGDESVSNRDTRPYAHDGITTVEAFMTWGGSLRLRGEFNEVVGIQLMGRIEGQSEHFLTIARTGEDFNNDGKVDLDPDARERNPRHNPTYDSVGRRFWLEKIQNFELGASVWVQF